MMLTTCANDFLLLLGRAVLAEKTSSRTRHLRSYLAGIAIVQGA